jgi:biotin carboxyl carrier protein
VELIVLRNGEEHRVEIELGDQGSVVRIGERTYLVDRVPTSGTVRSLVIEGRQFEVSVRPNSGGRYQVGLPGAIEEVEVLDPLTYLAEKGGAREATRGPRTVTAYMPGRVVALLVEEGQEVESGEGLVVLEAMKMENDIRAETAGVVSTVLVTEGQTVEGGDPLFEIG